MNDLNTSFFIKKRKIYIWMLFTIIVTGDFDYISPANIFHQPIIVFFAEMTTFFPITIYRSNTIQQINLIEMIRLYRICVWDRRKIVIIIRIYFPLHSMNSVFRSPLLVRG